MTAARLSLAVLVLVVAGSGPAAPSDRLFADGVARIGSLTELEFRTTGVDVVARL